jgi:hypothetical protein
VLIDSELDTGTTVRLLLPLAKGPPDLQERRARLDEPR